MTSKGLEEHSLTIKNRHLDTSNSIILDRLKQKQTSKKKPFFYILKNETKNSQNISNKDACSVSNAHYFLIKNVLHLSFFNAIQNKLNKIIEKNNELTPKNTKRRLLNIPINFPRKTVNLVKRKAKPLINTQITNAQRPQVRSPYKKNYNKLLLVSIILGFSRFSKKYKRLINRSKKLKKYKLLRKKRLIKHTNKNRAKSIQYNPVHFFSEKKIHWTELQLSLRSKHSANSENYDDKLCLPQKANTEVYKK